MREREKPRFIFVVDCGVPIQRADDVKFASMVRQEHIHPFQRNSCRLLNLGLDPSDVGASGSRLKVERLYIPETDSNVEFMEGDTPQEQAAALVQKLQADKLI